MALLPLARQALRGLSVVPVLPALREAACGACHVALQRASASTEAAVASFEVPPNLTFASQPKLGKKKYRPPAQVPDAGVQQTREQGAKQDIELPVYNWQREEVGTFVLAGDVFDVPIRRDILHQVVRWQRAKARQGTHKGKSRGEVRGGGRKPWPQKGLGRARAGSIRGPTRVGGGKAFPPQVRSHAFSLPKKVRRAGLASALSAKAWEGRLIITDAATPEGGKTSSLVAAMRGIAAAGPTPRVSALLCDANAAEPDGGVALRRAAANAVDVDVIPSEGLNVLSILKRDYLVLTVAAADAVTARLHAPIKR